MTTVQIGKVISKRTLVTAESEPIQIPDAKVLTHLQFRRFAGCPYCSVHLHSMAQRHSEILAAGIRVAVVFRSTVTALRHHYADTPFAVIADPRDTLYTEFGVGSGLGSILNPRAFLALVPKIIRMFPRLPGIPPWGKGVLGLPADFLIAPDGRVVACKYGTHADDQWSVDQLLELAHSYVREVS